MDPQADTALAYSAFAARRYGEAEQRVRRLLALVPADPAVLTLAGRLSIVAGEPAAALEAFSRVLQDHPTNGALWLDLSLAQRDLGQHGSALESARRATMLAPRDARAWLQQGELLLSLDSRAAAAECFEQALTLQPSGAGFRGLSLASQVDASIIERMHRMLANAGLSSRDSIQLHYTLAAVYRRQGDREQFVRHLLTANNLQRRQSTEGRADYAAVFDELESQFTVENFAAAARAEPVKPMPLFILGMPRSGTTLVERLLSAHPQVAAGGELDYMRRVMRRRASALTGEPFPAGWTKLSRDGLTSLARGFAERLAMVDSTRTHVSDKTPGNYHLLGFLRVLFPAAPIVHVVRDPMDTCFSILQYPFDDRSPHTSDMRLLAYVYARYVRLMQRWGELCVGQFVTVLYESLVAAPAQQSQRMFEHCGLEWRDEYLDFHRSAAAVRTFSATQVREPVHDRSVGAWREFAEVLEPLRNALREEFAALGLVGDGWKAASDS